MSETLASLSSENLNPGLSALLQDVQRGHIRVPRFQRPFVWNNEQRLLLLESIRENMPIGSLLLWRTGKLELACFTHIGPHSIESTQLVPGANGWQYLLDGHQRVSTLLSVLMPAPATHAPLDEAESELDWDIQYDLMHEEFVFTKSLEQFFPKPPLLPLWTLFDARLVNKQLREMRKQIEQQGWPEAEFDRWEARADQLAYRFQQYKIPVLVMATDDLDLAARTFQRINSQGTKMDEANLVTALTWTPDFNLREQLATFRQELPLAWHELEDKLFLQVCKGLISPDIHSVKEQRLVKALKTDTTLLPRAKAGINAALDLLMRLGGVVRPELLPYSMQLVLLAVELDYRKGQPIQEQDLMNWFWRTSWTEAFSTNTSRRAKAEQGALRNAHCHPTQPLPQWKNNWDRINAFNWNFARNKAWMLRVAQRKDLVNENSQKIDGVALLERYGKEAFVKLLPEPRGASPRLKSLLNTVGNRFLTDPTHASALRQCLTSGSSVSSTILMPHFIDKPELNLLHGGNFEAFITARNERITRWISGEYRKVVNTPTHPPPA